MMNCGVMLTMSTALFAVVSRHHVSAILLVIESNALRCGGEIRHLCML